MLKLLYLKHPNSCSIFVYTRLLLWVSCLLWKRTLLRGDKIFKLGIHIKQVYSYFCNFASLLRSWHNFEILAFFSCCLQQQYKLGLRRKWRANFQQFSYSRYFFSSLSTCFINIFCTLESGINILFFDFFPGATAFFRTS